MVRELSSLKRKLETQNEKVDRLEAKVDSLEAKNDNLEANVDNLEAKVDNLEANVDNLEANVDNLKANMDNLEAKVDNLESNVDNLKVNVDNLKANVDNLEANADNLEANVDNLEAKVDNLKANVDNLEANVDNLEANVDNLKANVDNLEANVDNLEANVDNLKANLENLEAKVELQANDIIELKTAKQECNVHDDEQEKERNGDTLKHDASGRITSKTPAKFSVKRQRRASFNQGVAFFSTLTPTISHLGANQNVVFDKVITNVGNGYNPHVGDFVAPVAGIYVFSTTITTSVHHWTHYGMFKNGVQPPVLFVNGIDNAYDSSSDTVILRLAAGDDVEVPHTDYDHAIQGDRHFMFSGFLLMETGSEVGIVG